MSTKERKKSNATEHDVPAGGDPPVSRTVPLSLDTTLEILASRERRLVLGYLSDTPGRTATIDELTDHLRRNDSKIDPPNSEPSVTLVHVHLPKLEDTGVIEYDGRNRTVRYRHVDRLDDWLARIRAEKTN